MNTYPPQPLLVAVVGVGLVGSEFIRQLLLLPQPSPFKLISLTSSSRTIFAGKDNPIIPAQLWEWKSILGNSPTPSDLWGLTSQLTSLVESNERVALVDNTSSDDVAAFYPFWLSAGINVVTPNKRAFSGERILYEQILQACRVSGAKCLHEATVGAGLPIIGPLKELLATGDKITKIEGVFSGTMSYIFNEFSTIKAYGPTFSHVVSLARSKGYTEPHPGDDLNGHDVARKLTILSRIISYSPFSTLAPLESFLSCHITSLIPPSLQNIPTGDEFLDRLPQSDTEFSKMRDAAFREGTVLRFVGIIDIEKGYIKAGLERYPVSHPFVTSLAGSDCVVMFHTERYSLRPLVIQGAGAGAAVTAMGVLGDLFKLVS